MHSQFQTTQLSNGITVITDKAEHFQTAAVSMKFAVGSVHEPEHLCGISHLLEHLIFRGSPKLDGDAFQRAIGTIGATINGCTDEDTTTFTASVLKDDLQHVLNAFGEVLCNPLLDDEDIKLEKQIVEQENCRGCANCTMRESLFAAAYPDQALRHPIIGYEDTIEAITREDLISYHARHYTTGNLIVSVAGDVEHTEVLAHIQAAFAGLTIAARAPLPSFEYTPGEIAVASSSDQAAINIHFDISDLSLDRFRELVHYEDVLGGHGHSKLLDVLREKRGLVYSTRTYFSGVGTHRFLNVIAWCEARKAREVAGLIGECMQDLASNITQQDLDEAKRRCRTGILSSLDELEDRADTNACDELYQEESGLDPIERIDAYLKIDLDPVKRAAQDLLARDPAIFLGGSQRSMPSFDEMRASLKGTAETASPKRKRLFRMVG